jgi:hypothetical protein
MVQRVANNELERNSRGVFQYYLGIWQEGLSKATTTLSQQLISRSEPRIFW